MSAQGHWLDLSPRDFLDLVNGNNKRSEHFTTMAIGLNIRRADSLLVRDDFRWPNTYRIPTGLITPNGQEPHTPSIRDEVIYILKNNGGLSPDSMIRLQFVDYSQRTPPMSPTPNTEAHDQQLQIMVLLVADRRDLIEPTRTHVRWVHFAGLNRDPNNQRRLRPNGYGHKFSDKQALLANTRISFRSLAVSLIGAMIKTNQACMFTPGKSCGYIIVCKKDTGVTNVLLFPRQAEYKPPMPEEEDAVYILIGEWDETVAVTMVERAEVVWVDLFGDDGRLRVDWIDMEETHGA